MKFIDLISPDRTSINADAFSKKAVLLQASQMLAHANPYLNAHDLFEAFWHRESLGSTAIGYGITIPHIRTEHIYTAQGCFIKLQHPIDFGAEDKQPVDLILAFMVPAHEIDDHLSTLAAIMKRFNDSRFREACRKARTNEELYQVLAATKVMSPDPIPV